jgi:hypothetical protein
VGPAKRETTPCPSPVTIHAVIWTQSTLIEKAKKTALFHCKRIKNDHGDAVAVAATVDNGWMEPMLAARDRWLLFW